MLIDFRFLNIMNIENKLTNFILKIVRFVKYNLLKSFFHL